MIASVLTSVYTVFLVALQLVLIFSMDRNTLTTC